MRRASQRRKDIVTAACVLGTLWIAVFLIPACSRDRPAALPSGSASPTPCHSERSEESRSEESPRPPDASLLTQPILEGSVRFDHLSLQEGLSQSSVCCMIQDHRGFMWFGTADGLNRYDGYEFKVYKHNPADPHSFSRGNIMSILQDRFGALWIVTDGGGIDRYDEETDRFVHYRHDPDDPRQSRHSLSDDFVWDVYEDRSGTIWVGTYTGGLNQYDRQADRFNCYRHDPDDPYSLSHDKVYAMYEDRAGTFWVGTAGGLDRLSRSPEPSEHVPREGAADRATGHFTHYRHDPNDPHTLGGDYVQLIYEDHAGRFWLATYGSGLNLFDRETGRVERFQHDPEDPHTIDVNNRIMQIHEDRMGYLWILHFDGRLDRFDPSSGTFTRYRHDPEDPHSLSHDTISFVAQDRAGNLWVGTLGGLDRFDWDSGQFIHYRSNPNDPHSLSDDQVLSFYEDRSGVLWIGTLAHGLNRYAPQKAKFAHHRLDPAAPDGVSNNTIYAIYQEAQVATTNDRQGTLWVGSQAGLNRLDLASGTLVRYRHAPDDPDSLGGTSVRAIYEDRAGRLWIGTDQGLDRLDRETGRWIHYRNVPEGSTGWQHGPVSILEDETGALWLGVYAWGLDRFNPDTGQFTRYEHNPDSSRWYRTHAIQTIYQDRTGALWMGTGEGLVRFDRATETFFHYQHNPDDPRSLGANDVLAIYEDSSANLWIGTNGGGLNRLDGTAGTFTRYTEKDGLPNGVIYGILEDDASGELWVSTNRGLSRFNPRTETFRNYDVEDGLQSNEFNLGACSKNDSGVMFFGGVNGFNAFHPANVHDNPYIPPVVLTALTRSGEAIPLDRPVESTTAIVLKWPNNFFEFEFAALSFAQPEKNQYAYMLEGFDQGWNEAGPRRFGRYTNLPGGTYTLRLKGSNNDRVWNQEGTAIQIKVVPPFWQTWWFAGIAAVVVVGGVLGGYRLRVRSIEAQRRALQSQVEVRTREIEHRRQELEALYRADERMHRYLQLDQVLQALVDVAVDILHADKSTVLVWSDAAETCSGRPRSDSTSRHCQRLVACVARGFDPQTLPALSFGCSDGLIGHVAASGEIAVVADTLLDPRRVGEPAEALRIVDAEGIRSLIHLPIAIHNQVFAVFNVSFTRPHAFGEDELRLFQALAQRAALAIENAQLYEQTQELAVVQERSRLARELHDAVTQTLFSSSLIAEALPGIWENNPQEGRQLLKEIRQLSRGAMAEMRTLLLELRPAALVEANLSDLLRQLGEAVTGRKGIPVTVTVQENYPLPTDVHVALYRIAQEALNNVIKHAQASQVEVSLRCQAPSPLLSLSQGEGLGPAQANATRSHQSPERGQTSVVEGAAKGVRVELRIRDDGRGFDPATVPPDRLGLGIIRERAQAIGAALEMQSAPGAGTQVTVVWQSDASETGPGHIP